MNTNIDFDNPLGFNPFSLKLPPFGTPFYTVEEYEQAMQSGGSYDEICAREEAKGRGFGFVYMYNLHAMNPESITGRFAALIEIQLEEDEDYRLQDALEEMTRMHDSLRQNLAVVMQSYIRSRHGVIDCWPEETADMRPKDERGLSDFSFGDLLNIFGYFTPEINWYRKESVRRLGDIELRNAYSFREDKQFVSELTNAERRIKQLKQVPVYTRKQQRSSNFRFGIAIVPSIYLFLCALMVIVWKFFPAAFIDITTFPDLFASLHPAASAALFVPLILYALPAAFYPLLTLWAPLVWIAAVTLIGLGVYLWFDLPSRLNDAKWISKKAMQAGLDAREELKRLKNDGHLAELRKLEDQIRTHNRYLSETWHKAWFNAVQESRF